MGKEAYVVLGTSIPEGKTSYVLLNDKSKDLHKQDEAQGSKNDLVFQVSPFLLINPLTGQIYHQMDRVGVL